MLKTDMLLCLDPLNIATTLESIISFSFRSSKKNNGNSDLHSCGYFTASIDSYVSFSVSDFAKFLWTFFSSLIRSKSSSLRMF